MLQLARGGGYAVMAILFLASKPKGEIYLANNISAAHGIPRFYLAKVMQSLVKAGLVKSRRGPKGGFMLARGAAQITLWEIVEAVDGPINISSCLMKRIRCTKYDICPVHPVLNEAGTKIIEVLNGTTIADLVRNKKMLRNAVRRRA